MLAMGPGLGTSLDHAFQLGACLVEIAVHVLQITNLCKNGFALGIWHAFFDRPPYVAHARHRRVSLFEGLDGVASDMPGWQALKRLSNKRALPGT